MRWLILLVAACGDNNIGTDRLGGATTVDDRTREAFTHPLANLDMDGINRHNAGHGPFAQHWSEPQGLGPLFNHDGCISCHGGNGRGQSQIAPDVFGSQALVRCSMPTGEPEVPGGQAPVPGLGTQLQDHSSGESLPEVYVTLAWQTLSVAYDDGTAEAIRAPNIGIARADSSPFPDDALVSYRQAPPVIGLGLLDAIDEADLVALEKPGGGHGNIVWNPLTQAMVRGRFGHKASQPRLELQAAGAFANDIGLSSRIFPEADGSRDLSDPQLDDMVFFIRTLAVPASAPRDDAAWRGAELFAQFHCDGCHVETFVTGDSDIPELAHQTIHPYTDLLLHDMGPGLADGRPDFRATGSEWRTPPLWGIGLAQVVDPATTFLHDGRARTFAEAILWHGGEAMAAREAFRTAEVADRVAIVAFLSTL